MKGISKRRILIFGFTFFLSLCLGLLWFRQLLKQDSFYPNATLTGSSGIFTEIGVVNRSQFQISHYVTDDSYQEVLKWFLDNDWGVFLASPETWYRLTKEEIIWDYYSQIRLFYSIDIQPTENGQTCITQVVFSSVTFSNGKILYRSPDYVKEGSDYYHFAPDCSEGIKP